MIGVTNLTHAFGSQMLFKEVNMQFSAGNCYGLIGANGSGKSTFLKILSGEVEATQGEVFMSPGERMAVLRQDHFAFDEHKVMDTVLMGFPELYNLIQEREALYAKAELTEDEGMHLSELEGRFADLDGWSAESEAAKMLSGLGIGEDMHARLMKELEPGVKVRVLLAQALFGNPDVLLLDEPTNELDAASRLWLEEFLIEFKNTVIVVSHDRHFLDQVCTHIADIDFQAVRIYSGNYTFWYEASQLLIRQIRDKNKKTADKIRDLQTFISRFANNASKSRQATSRKKILDKLSINDMKPSSRKYPYINFKSEKHLGDDVLSVEHLNVKVEGETVLRDFNLTVRKGQKIAFVGRNSLAATTLFQALMAEAKPESGGFKWGASTLRAYFPKDNREYFNTELNMVEWLRQYSTSTDENFIRGFLGRMLFTGEEAFKSASVLSGGEKVRCMLARVMMIGANVMILDEPTNHLDLESITALNEAMTNFEGVILFTSPDHQLIQTTANRIIEITPGGVLDKLMEYDEFVRSEDVQAQRAEMYAAAAR